MATLAFFGFIVNSPLQSQAGLSQTNIAMVARLGAGQIPFVRVWGFCIPRALRYNPPMQNFSLALARIAVGVCFFIFGFSKTFLGDAFGGKSFVLYFTGFVQEAITTGHPYFFWKPFLEHFVAPNAAFFAWSVAIGELLIGASLVLGFWTRLSAFFGVLLMLAIHFCSSPFASPAPLANQVGALLQHGSLVLLFLIFIGTDASKSLSVDSFRKMAKKAKSSEKEKASV